MLASKRQFLFLQGPHGPFFGALAKNLTAAGAHVHRVGFNAGDQAFWRDKSTYIPYRDQPESWPCFCSKLISDLGITDLVLYGDTRPLHRVAIDIARARGITVHVFEEGYLRPYWITYERGGVNGHSPLMDLDMDHISAAMDQHPLEDPPAPASWGDMREHIFYGALYHWFVLFMNKRYPHFKSHRPGGIWQEATRYSRRLATSALVAAERALATDKIHRSGKPYHLVLLQLDHDSNFRAHSPFANQREFMAKVIDDFAKCQSSHHQLVFKEHPLENAPRRHSRAVRDLARAAGIADRVHYVRGGKLAAILDDARTAITVNSTAGQQALWRGIPVKVFGKTIYDKPELVSDLPLQQFFDMATRPDPEAYRKFRAFLLRSSQIPGGYYSRRGRAQLLRQITDHMIQSQDPYDSLIYGPAQRNPLRVVS